MKDASTVLTYDLPNVKAHHKDVKLPQTWHQYL